MTTQEPANKEQSPTPVAVYYGSVKDFAPSFTDGEFRPFNAAYASFKPSPGPVDGPCGAVLEVFEGEWFSVSARHGYEGPTDFLHYPDAYMHSRQAGEYGGTANVYINSPAEGRVITALDAGGREVPVFTQTQFLGTRVSSRLRFPNR